MDENRYERFRELVNEIEPAEDAKGRILENVIYRKRKKVYRYVKYAAAAVAAVLICAAVINSGLYKEMEDQNGLNVYASELDGEDWLVLPEGEKRQLSGSNKTGWGYTFMLEIPEGVNWFYTQSGVSIGVDWVYITGNEIWWVVHDDSGYDFPDHMESELVIYLTDDEGNKTGRYRLILSKEEDACFVKLVNESYEIEDEEPVKRAACRP